ncbi:hypothetical protein AB4121_08905 [Vibrio sp. 10N.286.54.B2]|uniref:hypothetical protein n=1 Tax=Vibrio sp. 10N.286.54.B2 TaxID=3229718 RepID=UPI003550A88D
MPRKLNNKEDAVQPMVVESPEQATGEIPVNHFANIVLNGKAKKLSQQTENKVFYELAVHDVLNAMYLRLSGNEGGGLHSKEWIALEDIFAVLDSQKSKPFKSTVLKSVFKGGSANNVGFLAACLRDIALTIPAGKAMFLHTLAPEYEQRCNELRSLVSGVSNKRKSA